MIKTTEGLEEWLNKISTQKFKSAAKLPSFEYETKDFENIPQILTKFMFYLHSQVQCISQHLDVLKNLESTADLRDSMMKKQSEFYNEYQEFKRKEFMEVKDMAEKQGIKIQSLEDQTNMIQLNQETSGTFELKNMIKGPAMLKFPGEISKTKKSKKRKSKSRSKF